MNAAPPKECAWKHSRYGFVAFLLLSLLAACSLLRLVLFLKFRLPGPVAVGTVAKIFATGLHLDLFVAVFTTLPLLFWFWMIRDRWFGKLLHRIIFIGAVFVFWAVQIFLFFTEYYFFDEFKSRFNTVAVDYLLYPTEVFGNIRDSYPLYRVVAVCVALSAVWCVLAFRYFRTTWIGSRGASGRFLRFAACVVICTLLWVSLNPQASMVPSLDVHASNFLPNWISAHTEAPRISSDRTLNEIAGNGSLSFVDAFITHDLDYASYYRTVPRDEAYERVRKLLAEPGAEFVGDKYSIRRTVAGDPSRPKLNVVILLEESLGSEFWGCLGSSKALTPEMDKLATDEGLLFTNIYACGNRTVRGFEGVLSSFPPLPGDSIVKRDRSENVESIARVLKRDGYSTIFFYGGRGLFDSMSPYALRNGWDRFLEHDPPLHDDFPHPNFTTVWGVSDEEVFARAIEEFRQLNDAGKPFLGTVMSVSNHKPYTYPRGRIPDDPEKPKSTRAKAVKYSDWCLGQFFKAAKKEAFWTNTVFVVVADHGARVYGRQEIPIHSYEIPLVILGPATVKVPQRLGMLGSSLDVSPIILGLIGRPYETMFLGRDLLRDSPESGRALLNHNRDIGMFANDQMVVLGLQKEVEYYVGDPKHEELKLVRNSTPELLELEKNATAIYQVADDLYMHRLYRIDGMPAPAPTSPAATNTTTQQSPISAVHPATP